MKRVTQRVEKFFAEGSTGAQDKEKTLESVIYRMNSTGWRVDQIIPTSFRNPSISINGGLDVTSGILLCTQIE